MVGMAWPGVGSGVVVSSGVALGSGVSVEHHGDPLPVEVPGVLPAAEDVAPRAADLEAWVGQDALGVCHFGRGDAQKHEEGEGPQQRTAEHSSPPSGRGSLPVPAV